MLLTWLTCSAPASTSNSSVILCLPPASDSGMDNAAPNTEPPTTARERPVLPLMPGKCPKGPSFILLPTSPIMFGFAIHEQVDRVPSNQVLWEVTHTTWLEMSAILFSLFSEFFWIISVRMRLSFPYLTTPLMLMSCRVRIQHCHRKIRVKIYVLLIVPVLGLNHLQAIGSKQVEFYNVSTRVGLFSSVWVFLKYTQRYGVVIFDSRPTLTALNIAQNSREDTPSFMPKEKRLHWKAANLHHSPEFHGFR